MLKNACHIILALIFLTSTTGLTINMHYCQDKLYDIGFFSQADDCCNDNTHHHHCCQTKEKEHNCKDETIQIKVKDNFTLTSVNLDLNSSHFINLFLHSIQLFDFSNTQKDNNDITPLYISPPKLLELLSLLQTYLL